MTDLIKALSVALDRLSSLEETMNRLDRHSEMISRFNDRLDRFEARLTKAETKCGNIDVCIDTICALETKAYKLEERVQRLGVEAHDQITVNHDFEIRLKTLEERTLDDPEFERLLERVNVLESDVRCLETGDDLDSQIETVVERVLDRVLEDTLDSALSGREITVTL